MTGNLAEASIETEQDVKIAFKQSWITLSTQEKNRYELHMV